MRERERREKYTFRSGTERSGMVSNSYHGIRFNGQNTRMPGAPWNQNRHIHLWRCIYHRAKSGAAITIVPHTIESKLIPNCFTE